MSTKYEELVRAESEEPEGEPTPEPVPDEGADGGEQEGGAAEARAAALPPFDEKALEKELERHAKALEKIVGAGWVDMVPCEACGTAGYVPQFELDRPKPLEDDTLVVCDACNGYGERLTPSLVPERRAITCTVCTGLGYRDRGTIEATDRAAAYHAAPADGYQPPPPKPEPWFNYASGRWELPPDTGLTAPAAAGYTGEYR